MTDRDMFDRLLGQIQAGTGLQCGYYREQYLRRRIQIRMDVCGAASYGDYAAYLETHPGEYAGLLDCIGVNFSEFFRDVRVFETIARAVLPETFGRADAAGGATVRVLSAPCATGEEPYSFAIIMRELAARGTAGGGMRIHGVDIDEEALAQAREGVYPLQRLATVGDRLRQKYFLPCGDGKCRVVPEVREMVEWSRVDLMAEQLPPRYDIVLCRNLLIYVREEFHPRLLDRIAGALRPGGYLVLGATESLPAFCRPGFEPVAEKEKIYRKVASPRRSTDDNH